HTSCFLAFWREFLESLTSSFWISLTGRSTCCPPVSASSPGRSSFRQGLRSSKIAIRRVASSHLLCGRKTARCLENQTGRPTNNAFFHHLARLRQRPGASIWPRLLHQEQVRPLGPAPAGSRLSRVPAIAQAYASALKRCETSAPPD